MALKKNRTGFYPQKYVFTDVEKQQLGESLARSMQADEDLDDEIAAAKASFANRKKALKKERLDLKHKVNAGYEVRERECWVRLNTATGEKEYYDKYSDQLIGTKPMEREDRQTDIEDESETLPEIGTTRTLEELRAAAAFFIIYHKPQHGALAAVVVLLGDTEGAPQEIVNLGRDRVGITYRSAEPFDKDALHTLIDSGEAEVTMDWNEMLTRLGVTSDGGKGKGKKK